MYIIVSHALGIVATVMTLSGIVQGNGGGAAVCALFAAFFIWCGYREQQKRKALEAELADLKGSRK